MSLDRRFLLLGGTSLSIAALGHDRNRARAQPAPEFAPTGPERRAMADLAAEFMQAYEVPGLGVAIVRRGALVYDEAFGLADKEAGTRLTPSHRFRIASLSKPITAVAIFALVEQRVLGLQDRVFGPGAILGNDYGPVPAGSGLDQVTVDHLLTHSSGGWPNDDTDPMFQQPQLDHRALLEWTLKNRPLASAPGTTFAYSNFGYCVLGRVIEKVTGRTYARFVQEAVLGPAGIADMEIAGNTPTDRRPQEVRYHGQGGDRPYGINVARMDSHGGWLARPAALAVFASRVDGSSRPSLLKRESVETMTRASATSAGYARGWRINRVDNWWHGGSLAGTSAIMVRTHSGFCWAALVNTRRPGSAIGGDLDKLVWTMARKVSSWRP